MRRLLFATGIFLQGLSLAASQEAESPKTPSDQIISSTETPKTPPPTPCKKSPVPKSSPSPSEPQRKLFNLVLDEASFLIREPKGEYPRNPQLLVPLNTYFSDGYDLEGTMEKCEENAFNLWGPAAGQLGEFFFKLLKTSNESLNPSSLLNRETVNPDFKRCSVKIERLAHLFGLLNVQKDHGWLSTFLFKTSSWYHQHFFTPQPGTPITFDLYSFKKCTPQFFEESLDELAACLKDRLHVLEENKKRVLSFSFSTSTPIIGNHIPVRKEILKKLYSSLLMIIKEEESQKTSSLETVPPKYKVLRERLKLFIIKLSRLSLLEFTRYLANCRNFIYTKSGVVTLETFLWLDEENKEPSAELLLEQLITELTPFVLKPLFQPSSKAQQQNDLWLLNKFNFAVQFQPNIEKLENSQEQCERIKPNDSQEMFKLAHKLLSQEILRLIGLYKGTQVQNELKLLNALIYKLYPSEDYKRYLLGAHGKYLHGRVQLKQLSIKNNEDQFSYAYCIFFFTSPFDKNNQMKDKTEGRLISTLKEARKELISLIPIQKTVKEKSAFKFLIKKRKRPDLSREPDFEKKPFKPYKELKK